MRTLGLLTLTALLCYAQAQQPPAGQARARGRGNRAAAPSPSAPYPGTLESTAATGKLIQLIKSIAPDGAGRLRGTSAQQMDAEKSLREVLNPRPANPNPNAPPPTDRVLAGTAAAGEHGEFVFAVETASQPVLHVTNVKTNLTFEPWKLGKLWIYQGPLKTGSAYRFHWMVDGKTFGGANDLPAFTEDSYPRAGVPQGKLVGPIELVSKVYPDMRSNIWYYVPAQWDGSTALPVQVWGDGQFYIGVRPTPYRLLDTFDNLTAQKKIPAMVNVFVQPGTTTRSMRSIEYDTVDDRYANYIVQEVLAEVEKGVKLRHDGYSRAMVGESSGGICAFNAAYRQPEQFTRVLSWIGSFTALQVSPEEPTGGASYAVKVRMEPKKNIRVWLQDGVEDQENPRAGSWPLQNIQLANSLKLKGYDYHFSLGPGTHSQRQGSAELPESLIWLWRDYDPSKTTQDFVQEESEAAKPLWRVVTMNRE